MALHRPTSRRMALRTGAALVLATLAAPVLAYGASPALCRAVDVYDRTIGSPLPVYEKDGRRYVVGTPGNEYAVRIRNCTGRRILAVTSVDGVNAITGETASPDQSGLRDRALGQRRNRRLAQEHGAHRRVLLHGPRQQLRCAHGTPVRRRRHRRRGVRRTPRAGRPNAATDRGRAQGRARDARGSTGCRAWAARNVADAQEAERASPEAAAPSASFNGVPLAKLGTGHGRSESSHARRVSFVRATAAPAQVLSIQYDRHENLAALGVVPQRPAHVARHHPRPFPGLRFAPDPR